MSKSKIVLLALYALFMISFFATSLAGARSSGNAQMEPARIASMGSIWIFAIALAVSGGFAAYYADRRVAGWVVGCLFIPWVCPLVLALLKDLPSPAPRTAGAPIDVGVVDLARKRQELDELKAKGILDEAEYGMAMAKLEAKAGAAAAGKAGA
jgi:hypothetical protein